MATGTLEQQDIPANSFDAVTAWDVIEHLPNPELTLRHITTLLKPGGVLAINTPHGGSMLTRLLKTHWHLVVPPEHVHFFNPHNLERLLSPMGLNVLMHKKIGKKFTLPYILQMLGSWWKIPALMRLSECAQASPLKHIAVPINLRDNFFLIAQKKL